MTKKICILNYKINNLSSIIKAMKQTNNEFDVLDDGSKINKYSHIILPGVGSFDAGINQLKKLKFYDYLVKNKSNINIFGICLGMQILFEKSEESKSETCGLGFIEGSVKKIVSNKKNNIFTPHVGWNNIYSKLNKNIFNIDEDKDFYYANSYYVDPKDKKIIKYYFSHGNDYPAVIAKDNIYGVQFHPEKSDEGIKILKYFCEMN